MTVRELIKQLKTLPGDAEILAKDGAVPDKYVPMIKFLDTVVDVRKIVLPTTTEYWKSHIDGCSCVDCCWLRTARSQYPNKEIKGVLI